MLKMTNVKLELISDIDMFQFIEKGMRGGVSDASPIDMEKQTTSYMKSYNKNTPQKYIMDLDANNLYGWAMSQHLPTGGFKWLSEKQINKLDLAKYHDKSIYLWD